MSKYREMRRYAYHVRVLGALQARLESHGWTRVLTKVRKIRTDLIDREMLTPRQEIFIDGLARQLEVELPYVC